MLAQAPTVEQFLQLVREIGAVGAVLLIVCLTQFWMHYKTTERIAKTEDRAIEVIAKNAAAIEGLGVAVKTGLENQGRALADGISQIIREVRR